VEHAQGVYVIPWNVNGIGTRGGHQIRCESCRSAARQSNVAGCVIGVIVVIAVTLVIVFVRWK
jgi:hypothetical protein